MCLFIVLCRHVHLDPTYVFTAARKSFVQKLRHHLLVLIDSSLSWEKHISRTRKKCYSGLSQLRRLGSIPPNLKKQLYNSLVLPHLDYCSVVWQEASMILLKSIEQVQNYGMRIILGKPPRSPSEDLRQQLQWCTLAQRRKQFRLSLIHRCVSGSVPDYLKNKFTLNSTFGYSAQGVPTNFICIGLGLTFIGNLWFLQDLRTGICFQQILECYRPNLLLEVH